MASCSTSSRTTRSCWRSSSTPEGVCERAASLSCGAGAGGERWSVSPKQWRNQGRACVGAAFVRGDGGTYWVVGGWDLLMNLADSAANLTRNRTWTPVSLGSWTRGGHDGRGPSLTVSSSASDASFSENSAYTSAMCELSRTEDVKRPLIDSAATYCRRNSYRWRQYRGELVSRNGAPLQDWP